MARRLCIVAAAVALLAATAAAPSAGAACPNETIRQEQGMTHLPDCMALELVSPPAKGGMPAKQIQTITDDGGRVLFRSPAVLGDSTGLVNPVGDFYVAERGAAGWSSYATTAPGHFGFGFGLRDAPRRAGFFTPDLSRWISVEQTEPEYLAGEQTVYEGGLGGPWVPRSPLLEPLDDPAGIFFEKDAFITVQAATPDLGRVFFQPLGRTQNHYLPGDPEPVAVTNVYEAGNTYVFGKGTGDEPTMELLARDASGQVWGGNCGAWPGGGGTAKRPGGRNQGAVSPDGSRVIFTTRPDQEFDEETGSGPLCDLGKPLRIMSREETLAGPQITELLPSVPAGGSDHFEGASTGQRRIYFVSPRPLAPSDLDPAAEECHRFEAGQSNQGCDLYLYEDLPNGGHEIVQVSAGGAGDPSPGEGAEVVKGVAAISADGSHVYFTARGVLTTEPNPEGDIAQPGDLNFYAYRRVSDHPSGRIAFVGALDDSNCPQGASSYDCGVLSGGGVSYFTNASAVPVVGDGHTLVFGSKAELTDSDADGFEPDVYRYETDSEPPDLECISCKPGSPDAQPFEVFGPAGGLSESISPGPAFAQYRWVSEDGESVGFSTQEALVSADTDGLESAYLWRSGELTLLPGLSRAGSTEAVPPLISADGSSVAFQSTTRLVPQDFDTAEDVYVARVNGGIPPAAPLTAPCSGPDQCRGPASAPPPPAAPGSAAFAGRGNAEDRAKQRRKAKKHKRRHARHHRGKQGKRKQGKQKHGRARRAGTERGGHR